MDAERAERIERLRAVLDAFAEAIAEATPVLHYGVPVTREQATADEQAQLERLQTSGMPCRCQRGADT